MSGRDLLVRLRTVEREQQLFIAFLLLLLSGGALALVRHNPLLMLPALLGVGLLLAFVDWRLLYYLLFTTLAFSMQFSLPGGLTMDVPSEPLMLALTACVGLGLALGVARLSWREVLHPVVLILALMLFWAFIDTFYSVDTTKSVKYLLAKVWFITPFLFGTLLVVRRPAHTWRFAACYAAGTTLAVLYVMSRHATVGFSFARTNWALRPFFLNHVIYATILALLLPFVLLGMRQARERLPRLAWGTALVVLMLGLFTSYTRASMLSVPVAGLYYLVMRFRLTRLLLLGTALVVGSTAYYFASDNTFMRYRPDYEKTIFNGHNFSKHLEATYKLEDVSGMERVYRWIAAARMISDKPLVGSGPATFYPEYRRYTVKSFRTYVSDNPEHSTTHNYFLLQLAEQGIPGFVLFCLLLTVALLRAESLYHRARDPAVRRVVLAATLSFIIIIFHLLLNELVEVDKIGPVYFVCLALLIKAETWVAKGAASDAR